MPDKTTVAGELPTAEQVSAFVAAQGYEYYLPHDMDDIVNIVQHFATAALAQKDGEIRRLREQSEFLRFMTREAQDLGAQYGSEAMSLRRHVERLETELTTLAMYAGLLSVHVDGHFAMPTESSEAICKQWSERVSKQCAACTEAMESIEKEQAERAALGSQA